MWSLVSVLLSWALSFITGKKTTAAEPTVAEVSAEKGAVEQRADQAEKTIAIHEAAAAARTDADDRIMRERSKPSTSVGTSGLDDDPDGHWRD